MMNAADIAHQLAGLDAEARVLRFVALMGRSRKGFLALGFDSDSAGTLAAALAALGWCQAHDAANDADELFSEIGAMRCPDYTLVECADRGGPASEPTPGLSLDGITQKRRAR
jgi:hypothetical protein